jgi:hypothetical protein
MLLYWLLMLMTRKSRVIDFKTDGGYTKLQFTAAKITMHTGHLPHLNWNIYSEPVSLNDTTPVLIGHPTEPWRQVFRYCSTKRVSGWVGISEAGYQLYYA